MKKLVENDMLKIMAEQRLVVFRVHTHLPGPSSNSDTEEVSFKDYAQLQWHENYALMVFYSWTYYF